MPRVSVVIATYRRPVELARAIASALAQTLADLEVIVAVEQDDPATLAALADIADARVRHVVNPVKAGPGPARDTGAAASAGAWIAFLDDDDEWLPDKLARQLAALSGPMTIATCLSRVVSPQGTVIRPTTPYTPDRAIDEWLFDRRSWLKGSESMLQTSSLVVPRALFDRIGFGTAQHEEWELMIRAIKQHGFTLVTVPEPLVVYHTGRSYSWAGSVGWIAGMRDVVTPRAYAGFCLTVVTQGLGGPGRTRAFATLLGTALRHGRPTPQQLFAFALIWLVPHRLRRGLRAALGRTPEATAAVTAD